MSEMGERRLLGVWHFSFTVADLSRSIQFYRDLLGFELIHTQEGASEYTRRLVGYADAHVKTAQFAVPGQGRGISSHDLELVQYLRPRGRRQEPAIYNPGEAHLGFAVADIHAMHRRLSASGVRFVSDPVAIAAGVNQGGFACHFFDPDQIVLEMVQPPPHRLSSWPFVEAVDKAEDRV